MYSLLVRGIWDGSKKKYGRSGCGVVVKGVDWAPLIKVHVKVRDGRLCRKVKEVNLALTNIVREVYVSSLVDVDCSEGRRHVRTKLGGTCFRSFCFSESLPEHMFWDMLPAPVLIGRTYRKAFVQHRRWLVKKKIFDEKEGEWSWHAPVNLEAGRIRGTFLKYFSYSARNELDRCSRCHTNMDFLHAVVVMDKNWWMGKEERR